jgi:hypothetical protein
MFRLRVIGVCVHPTTVYIRNAPCLSEEFEGRYVVEVVEVVDTTGDVVS